MTSGAPRWRNRPNRAARLLTRHVRHELTFVARQEATGRRPSCCATISPVPISCRMCRNCEKHTLFMACQEGVVARLEGAVSRPDAPDATRNGDGRTLARQGEGPDPATPRVERKQSSFSVVQLALL